MAKRLILLRHAKADYAPAVDAADVIVEQAQLFQTSPALPDLTATALAHQAGDRLRPLAASGASDAPAAGRWMKANNWIPDAIICSDALRTRQTCLWVCEQLGEKAPTPYLDSRIYGADATELISIINETPESVDTLLMVGHMPTVQDVAMRLSSADSDEDAVLAMASNYPPLGLCAFSIAGSWAELDGRDARLEHFEVPRRDS